MRITVDETQIQQLTTGPAHHAFTSIAQWRGKWYVAYREAESHAITPAGMVLIRHSKDALDWPLLEEIAYWQGETYTVDLRDPRLIAMPEALYCLCGAYTPKFPAKKLQTRSYENLIQSYLTYTEDGKTWAPLHPVGRPGYWIWSAIRTDYAWYAAAYHTGSPSETSSIHLLSGKSLLELLPHAMIYDGSSFLRDGSQFQCAHQSPAEPVLYQPAPGYMACCLRTEDTMEIGISRAPYQSWRWHPTREQIHPSAVIDTPYGWVLAGRELRKQTLGKQTWWDLSTSLYHLNAQFPKHLCRLPSAHDTGYASIAPGRTPDEYLVSLYSQHHTPTTFGTPLLGAHVFVSPVLLHP